MLFPESKEQKIPDVGTPYFPVVPPDGALEIVFHSVAVEVTVGFPCTGIEQIAPAAANPIHAVGLLVRKLVLAQYGREQPYYRKMVGLTDDGGLPCAGGQTGNGISACPDGIMIGDISLYLGEIYFELALFDMVQVVVHTADIVWNTGGVGRVVYDAQRHYDYDGANTVICNQAVGKRTDMPFLFPRILIAMYPMQQIQHRIYRVG